MESLCLSIVMCSVVAGLPASGESVFRDIPMAEVQAVLSEPVPLHPRLLVTDASMAQIQAKLESQLVLQTYYEAMLAKADDLLAQPPVERAKTGRRLLSISRRCLDRVIPNTV